MTTLQQHVLAETLLRSHRVSMRFADRLLADIHASKFAHCPAPGMNSPAFIVGHLSLYTTHCLHLLGRDDLVVEKEGWEELFKQGQPCNADDPRYPARDELVTHYHGLNEAIAAALEAADDELLAREVPMEGFLKDNFRTIAASINFLVSSHAMTHLGQLSAWRRIMGMKHAF